MVSKKRDDGEGDGEMKYGGAFGARFDKPFGTCFGKPFGTRFDKPFGTRFDFLRISSTSFPWLRKGSGSEDGISSFKTTFSTTLLNSLFFFAVPLKT